MKKFILALGLAGALAFGMGATSVSTDTQPSKDWSIAGYQISNPLADVEISNPLANVNIKEKFTEIASADPLSFFKMPEALKDVRFGNPIEPSTWWDATEHTGYTPGISMEFNIVDPEFWMNIINPKIHSDMHSAATNPANWAQLMRPKFYMAMVDPEIWAKWLDKSTYDVLRDPQTYAYWMQPGAYQHLVNVDHYKQMLEPCAYSELIDAAINNIGLTFQPPKNRLDLMGWANSISRTGSS